MAQINRGKVIVTDGSQFVDAAWEALVPGLALPFPTGSTLHFNPTGARAKVFEHAIGTSELVFGLLAGSADPAVADLISGPSPVALDAGTVTSAGSGSDTLADTGKAWVDDQWNGSWVVLRAGTSTEEWRLITDTVDANDEIVVDSNWTVAPSASDPYTIYGTQSGTLSSFKIGTPQDWTALGAMVNHLFTADPSQAWYTVAAVAARQLTLTGNYVVPANKPSEGVGYAVHSGFTAVLNLPLIEAGDTQIPSLFSRAMMTLDAVKGASYAYMRTLNFGLTMTNALNDNAVVPVGLRSQEEDGASVTGNSTTTLIETSGALPVADDAWNGMRVGFLKADVVQYEWRDVLDTVQGGPGNITIDPSNPFSRAPVITDKYLIHDPGPSPFASLDDGSSDWEEAFPLAAVYSGDQARVFEVIWSLSLDSPSSAELYFAPFRNFIDPDKDYAGPANVNGREAVSGVAVFTVDPGDMISLGMYSVTSPVPLITWNYAQMLIRSI